MRNNKIPLSEIIGKKFNRLVVIKEVESHIKANGKSARKFLCECECGNKTEVLLDKLRRNRTTSCGCYHRERLKEMNVSHGLCYHPLFRVLNNMKSRCYNTKIRSYKNYGGRGIIICNEWLNDFKAFYNWALSNGYQKGLEIDRTNNDGNYEPSNCRFVIKTINIRNRSNTKLSEKLAKEIRALHSGKGWGRRRIAKELNLNPGTVYSAITYKTWKGDNL